MSRIYVNGNVRTNDGATYVNSFNGRSGAVVPQSGDYTAAMVGAVPTSRTVNGQTLSANITLDAGDVGADVSGAAAAVQTNLNSHTGNTSNPHQVTAAQVGALPLTGGTLTGNLTGRYLTGTWLQTTAVTDLNAAATRFAVIDSSGCIYSRTASEMASDIGAATTSYVDNAVSTAVQKGIVVQATAPSDTSVGWVDTSEGDVLKYYDTVSRTWEGVVSVWG